MQVDLEYCLDPVSQTDCLHNPGALLPGRTVFYAVQPKYLNVDIRITIDVTEGGKIERRWYQGGFLYCSFIFYKVVLFVLI